MFGATAPDPGEERPGEALFGVGPRSSGAPPRSGGTLRRSRTSPSNDPGTTLAKTWGAGERSRGASTASPSETPESASIEIAVATPTALVTATRERRTLRATIGPPQSRAGTPRYEGNIAPTWVVRGASDAEHRGWGSAPTSGLVSPGCPASVL